MDIRSLLGRCWLVGRYCLEPPRWQLCICHPGSRVALDYEQPSVSLNACVCLSVRVCSVAAR